MDRSLYPEQEPFNENMQRYHDDLIAKGSGLQPLEFSYGNHPYQSLALFPAKEPTGDVVLFFHGGGWTNGYKEWMSFIAPALNDLGITFATAGYRLAPTHLFPVGLEDCAKALEWLVENVQEYGGDPKKIIVSGHSAGGHYASLLAVTEEINNGFKCNSWVHGCAPVSGIYYFGDNDGMAVRPRFLGPEENNTEPAASPMTQLSSKLPPFLLAWGDSDFPHLIRQAAEMQEALTKENVAVETLVLPNCNHFTASYVLGDKNGVWATALAKWIQQLA